MLRDGEWCSYGKENQWLSFDAPKVVHRGHCSDERCSAGRLASRMAQSVFFQSNKISFLRSVQSHPSGRLLYGEVMLR